MKIVHKIREKFAKSFLITHVNEMDRKQKQTNLKSARTVALLYYLPDETTYKSFEAILSRFSDINLKISVVCYTDSKVSPHYFIPKISQNIVTSKNVNWRFQPQNDFVKEFINTEFDILIDLSLAEYLPLLYCAALSKAGLKVGRFQENHQLFYDLMINTGQDETIDSFVTQVIHYLSRINN